MANEEEECNLTSIRVRANIHKECVSAISILNVNKIKKIRFWIILQFLKPNACIDSLINYIIVKFNAKLSLSI